MNRLSNYFQAQKLTKLLLAQAEEDTKNGNINRAVKNLTQAIKEQITACNNIASIAFKSKPGGK